MRRRAEAWERFSVAPMPTEAEEVWRYSGIDAFDLDGFEPGGPADTGGPDALAQGARVADALGPRSALVVTTNGVCRAVQREPGTPEALVVVAGPATTDGDVAAVGELVSAHDVGRDALAALHDAFLADVTVVRVARKVAVADPVVIVHLVAPNPAGSRGRAVFPRTLVRVGESAEVGVVEVVASVPDATTRAVGLRPSLVVGVSELDVGDDAQLRYASLQVLDPGATVLGEQASRVGRAGGLRSFSAGLGGRYARVRTDSDLVGPGAQSALLAAYLGTGEQVHDFRTLQDHHAGRTDSELLFKGAVADTARSVYSGLIRIRKGARGANAFQTNHNLVLSGGAHADSVPNLDIDENDVRCSHASTVGPIDEEQRYYLESRGIEPAVAERLIVQGFFADLAARAPFEAVGRAVEDAVRWRLAPALASGGTEGAGSRLGGPGGGGPRHG